MLLMCAGLPGPTANNRAQMKQINICVGPVSNGLLLARHRHPTPETQNSQRNFVDEFLELAAKLSLSRKGKKLLQKFIYPHHDSDYH